MLLQWESMQLTALNILHPERLNDSPDLHLLLTEVGRLLPYLILVVVTVTCFSQVVFGYFMKRTHFFATMLLITSLCNCAAYTLNQVRRLQGIRLREYSVPCSRNISLLSKNSDRSAATDSSFNSNAQLRRSLLRKALMDIGFDAEGIDQAVQKSMGESSKGYDGRHGHSAIRACRSFYYPKSEKMASLDLYQLKAAAARTARQVEFLWKRHQSHRSEWLRHHDATNTADILDLKRFPIILVLDNVRSAFNVGSLFRTADAAGCSEVLTVGITAHPRGNGEDKLRKSALGAELVVPTQHFTTLKAAVEHLRRDRGYVVLGMETSEKSRLYSDIKYDIETGVAFILGNEVTGVDASIFPDLDGLIVVPTFGIKNSLNVAACAPIVMYEVIRQWTSKS